MNGFRKRLIVAAMLACAVAAPAAAQNLIAAARSGDLEAVRAALPEGTAENPDLLVRPLYFASQRGHETVVRYLLDQGAPANAVTDFGSALQIASRGNHAGIVEILLDAGADPNLPGGEDSDTPLHDAAERGSLETAMLLVANGADVNARNDFDHPPAHLAARRGRSEMLDFLLSHGAKPRAVEKLTAEALSQADLDLGRAESEICWGCHARNAGEPSPGRYPGPHLENVIGREKAGLEGFGYSEALEQMDGVWTPEQIDRFIADPTGVAPGTVMGHKGIHDQATRLAIIAYLMTLSTD